MQMPCEIPKGSDVFLMAQTLNFNGLSAFFYGISTYCYGKNAEAFKLLGIAPECMCCLLLYVVITIVSFMICSNCFKH